MKRSLLLVAALLVPAVASSSMTTSAADTTTTERTRRQFSAESRLPDGTPMTITVVDAAAAEGTAQAAIAAALARTGRLAGELGGLQTRLNALGKSEPLALSPDAFAMLERAVTLAAQTRGWFDITAPSQKAWFIARDWRRIELDPEARTITLKSDGMRFDLMRFGKGYLVDLAMAELIRHGIANARVAVGPIERNVGQDIFTPWSVRINVGDSGEAKFAHRALSYALTNVATAHVTPTGLGEGLIDARNHKPVANDGMRSVTTIATDAATATANGIAVYTLGTKNGIKYMLAHPEVKGIVVDDDGQLFASAGLGNANITRSPAAAPRVTYDGGSNDLRQRQREETTQE